VRDRELNGGIYAAARIPICWIVNIPDGCVEVYTTPSGPCDEPTHAKQRDYSRDEAVPLILDGREIAQLRVRDLLPRVLPDSGTSSNP
jgi:hypothetical protein